MIGCGEEIAQAGHSYNIPLKQINTFHKYHFGGLSFTCMVVCGTVTRHSTRPAGEQPTGM